MIQFPVNKYDADHDVLHVYLNDETDEITGFKILDFTQNAEKVRKMYPQYNFVIN